MAANYPSSDDIRLAITLLAETNQAVKNVQTLERELEKLGVTATKAKAGLSSIGKQPVIEPKATQSVEKLNTALSQTPQATKSATSGLFSLRNVARTALGTFEAMAIFFLTQLVGQAIKKTIDSISQLEQSLIKLTIAEKAISKAGVDITPQQLSSIIKDVAAAYETVSKIDASKMVSNLAVLTKDLQLTAKEYRDLAMAIPLVAQQAGVSIDSATEQVINGLTKSGRGWADLGITVDAEIIKQKAVAEGLVATRAEYEALTAEQKQNVEVQALISILLENTNANLEEQSNYLNTIEGQTKSANAQWEDLLSTLGRIARPTIIIFLKEANTTLSKLNDWLDSNEQQWNHWSASVAAATIITGGAVKLMYQIIGGRLTVNPLQEMARILTEAGNAYREAMGLAKGLDDIGQDTPTGTKEEPQGSLEQDQEDLQKALEKMNDEILEAQLKLAQDMEDAQIDLGRKLVDITTEYAKKRADAEREYASKVADINSDYRNRIAEINSQQAEANQQARNDELEREAKFQEQMRQLKERFLMDLEDALHARDARQVLRLIKQYNLDKAQAEREHALEQETAQREQEERSSRFARERADAERDRKAKLADAQRDYADKLAKLKADEDAERAAAELAYQRKIQDLEREMQNRLEIVAANLIAEFNLTKNGLDAILALYQKYYSEIAGIYAAMNAMLAGQQNLLGGAATTTNGSGRPNTIGGGQRFAEGGSMIANKPTTVTFGDNNGEFELATFTPLQHAGKDMNKVFSRVAGGSSDGMGGTLELSLLLSPDLEARITRNTLDSVGQVITKVSRSKR